MEPRVESVGLAQPGKVAPRPNEGLLDRVARELAVAEDEAGGRIQTGRGRACQDGEGVAIAASRLVNERPFVHGFASLRRDTSGRARMVWRWRRPIRFGQRARPSNVPRLRLDPICSSGIIRYPQNVPSRHPMCSGTSERIPHQ
jgi:hypothetical protein